MSVLIRYCSVALAALALCTVSGCDSLPSRTESDLEFIVLGDWGDHGTPAQRSVAAAMNRIAAARAVDFVATVGDNFYQHGVTSADDPLFRRSFETVYDLPALKALDWYATLGNHDYQGNYRAQIEYGRTNPRWNMPATYYSRTVRLKGDDSVLLVFTDSNPFVRSYRERPQKYRGINDRDPAIQLRWLKQTLCESSARWKFVFAHHPIASDNHHGDTPELTELWLPVLKECGADVYFAGHEHNLEYRYLDSGLAQVISGSGSRLRPVVASDGAEFVVSRLGFAWVSVDSRSVSIEFVADDGTVLFAPRLTR